MKKVFLMMIACMGAVTLSAQQAEEPKTIALTAEERQLVENNNDFAFNLFRQVRGDGNQVVSPLSITYALGLSNNGAAGKTREEINKVLGSAAGSVDAINAFCRKMLTEAPVLDPETKANIANTIYLNKMSGYELKPSYVESAATYYDATPEVRNFNDGQTMDVINQWASDHTEGMIKEVLNQQSFNPYALSYLLNAIYFKGVWMNEFKEENTVMKSFNGGQSVPMMAQNEEFQYTDNDLYQAIHLPYGNGAYRMTLFLPREGKTIDDVLATMNGSNWQFHGFKYQVDLQMPRFETSTNVDLKKVMSALGMPTAFSETEADFSNMVVDMLGQNIFIGLMKQVAKIKVDEKGTEAAAVTIIGYGTSSMPEYATFHADRPFFYIISEQSTGAIFFIGQYMGKEESEGRETEGIRRTDDGSHAYDIYNLKGQRLPAEPARGLFIQDGKKIIR